MTFDLQPDVYGLRVLLDPEVETSPGVLTVRRSLGDAPHTMHRELGADHARFDVADRLSIMVRRDPMEAVLTAPEPISDELVAHPLLAWIASVVARWRGDTALHAAAVVLEERAWVLLGEPGGGKTTLAAALAQEGEIVLADDLCVVRDGAVHPGPRGADLREEAARHLGVGVQLARTIGRPRWRFDLGGTSDAVPLGGLIALTWGNEHALQPVGPAGRLAVLAAHEAFGLGPSSDRAFLDLLPFPAWRLRRPRTWDALPTALDDVRRAAQAAR